MPYFSNLAATTTPAIKVNGVVDGVAGLYDVVITRIVGNAEFYEDLYLRMEHFSGTLRIAAVGTPKNLGVYGFDSSTAGAIDPINPSTFPIANNGAANSESIMKASYGGISTSAFTVISSAAISADYDDIQTYWVMIAEAQIKYRITIMGGSFVTTFVERWNSGLIPTNTKITLPN